MQFSAISHILVFDVLTRFFMYRGLYILTKYVLSKLVYIHRKKVELKSVYIPMYLSITA